MQRAKHPPPSTLSLLESTALLCLACVCVCVASTYNTHIQIELTGKRQVPRACHQWRHPGEGEDSTRQAVVEEEEEGGELGSSLSTRQVIKSSSHQ